MTEKSSIISVRVTDDIKKKLEEQSKLDGITLNTLVSQILSKHVNWDRFAQDVGYVLTSRPFLKEVLETVPLKKITELSATICKNTMKDATRYMYGELTPENFISMLDDWLGASYIPYRKFGELKCEKYLVQHNLGLKWSEFFAQVVTATLEDMGSTTKNIQKTNESVSFDICLK